MRSYIPNTPAERDEMLKSIGLPDMDALFADIPEGVRLNRPLELPQGMSEAEVRRVFASLVARNGVPHACFRGAGAYDHYIPAAVPQLAMRSEFYTAYTPYQAEMSQGMLQAIFEFQTLICQLTGLDAANASVYDGASAAAEAMNMLTAAKRKNRVLVSAGLHPDVKAVLKTYARFSKTELVEIPLNENGVTDISSIEQNAENAAGLIAAQPNFLGCLEDVKALADATHAFGGLYVSYIYPHALGVLARPGDLGADIAVGDGQSLGLPLAYGGPYVGFMASTQKLMRNLPGRIAGETADKDGNRAFVLTLQAREQHIRREKASSNICSNQMLCAVTASIYLSLMGPKGLAEAANQSMQKAHYLAEGISRIKGMRLRYPNTPFFNEFTVDCDKDPELVSAALKERFIMGGLPLNRLIPEDTGMLWCATEQNAREDIDEVLSILEEVSA